MSNSKPTSALSIAIDVATTTAVQAMLSWAALAPAAIAPKLGESLGTSPSLVGYLISVAYGAAMLTSIPSGAIVRRFGGARTSQTALLLAAIGSLTIASGWLPAMVLGAAVIGLGYGLPNPAGAHLLARTGLTRFRNIIFSIKQTGVPLGGMAAGLIGPPLALAYGWPAALAAMALGALTLCALMQIKRAQWDDDRNPAVRFRENPFAGLSTVWRVPALRWLSLTCFCFAVVQLCLTTFLVSMLVAEVGLSLVAAGVVLPVVQVSGVVGRLLWGAVADRVHDGLGTLVFIGLAMAAGAIATALLGPGWPLWAIYAALLLFGVTAIGWNGVYLAEVAHLAPAGQSGNATGGSLFFTFGGVLVGPTLFALIHGQIGSYGLPYALLAAIALAGCGLLILARRAASSRPAA